VSSASASSNYSIYLISQNLAVFVETDASAVTVGLARSQSAASFSNSSVSGNYGFDVTGITTAGGINIVGQLISNGSGSFTGIEDVNQAGNLSTSVGFSGTYSINSAGRATARLVEGGATLNFIFYVAGPSQILFVEVDPAEVVTGFANKQF
jgi:hypothetical protein